MPDDPHPSDVAIHAMLNILELVFQVVTCA